MKVIQVPNFPENQFYKVAMPKKILVLHNTVSGPGVDGDINWWKNTPEKVGTPYLIDRNGDIYQLFDDKYWIHHLGIKQSQLNQFGSKVSNERLNQLSIGLEIDNWGGLVKRNGKWFNYAGGEVKRENVQEYPHGYRGYYAFEKYTSAQLKAVGDLLKSLALKYGIPTSYNGNMFDFNSNAVRGTHGIWTHTSYRPDKSDCHPQPELISMLKTLS